MKSDQIGGRPVQDLSSLCEPGSGTNRIAADASLAAAIDAFHDHPDMRLLPIVETNSLRPIGAVFERDIRDLLFNPFGHALLRNPGFGLTLGGYRRDCPIFDVETPLPVLLDSYARTQAAEGLILTAHGRLHGVLANRTLLYLAGRREAELLSLRTARFTRIEHSSDLFQREAAQLADALASMATEIENAAETMSSRATFNSKRASAVAGASTQTRDGMQALASKGHELEGAIQRIRSTTQSARMAATEAVSLVETGGRRADHLDEATQSIDAALVHIQKLAAHAQLLAINATIEASRMGKAGSGFTVIAREIRLFSQQTRTAAEEITDRVGVIRAAVEAVTTGHQGIENMVGTIEAISGSVNEAIEAQLGTMRLLAENVEQAANVSDDIQGNVMEISHAALAAACTADSMRELAHGLSSNAGRLRQRVDDYIADVRAA